jgi:hypothetical protein
MKNMVFKNILTDNPGKHEVSLEEIHKQTESRITKKCISKYFIRDKYTSSRIEDIKEWVDNDKKGKIQKNSHFFTRMNTRTGGHKIICKTIGTFYVVSGLTAYKILYVNEIKVEVEQLNVKEKTDV